MSLHHQVGRAQGPRVLVRFRFTYIHRNYRSVLRTCILKYANLETIYTFSANHVSYSVVRKSFSVKFYHCKNLSIYNKTATVISEREEDCIISEAMDREHEHAAAPSLSLLRVNATTDNNSNNSNQTGEVRHSSAQLSGAASAHDARERAIPMTPVLLASFPSQMQQTHHGEQAAKWSSLSFTSVVEIHGGACVYRISLDAVVDLLEFYCNGLFM